MISHVEFTNIQLKAMQASMDKACMERFAMDDSKESYFRKFRKAFVLQINLLHIEIHGGQSFFLFNAL